MISPPLDSRLQTVGGLASVIRPCRTLTCVVAEGEAEFLALAPLWEDLADRATNRSPSLAWSWLYSWWEAVGARCPKTGRVGHPYVVIVYDDLNPVAVYPFVFHRPRLFSLALRRLRPMGHSGELESAGLTEEALCLVADEYEERARAVVIQHVADGVAQGRWDCAIVRQMDFDEIPRPVRSDRRTVVASKAKPGPQIVRLPETWAEFRRGLSKSMRDNTGYYPRLIRREGHDFEIGIHRDRESIDRAVRGLVKLHRDRVYSEVGQRHQDYFADRWQPAMLAAGMQSLANEGRGFLATLEIGGRLVAAQSFLQTDSELLVHYSGFDPEYARYSPLLVLQTEVFRRAIEQMGIRKINLLFGKSPWQKRWGSESEGVEARALVIGVRPTALFRAAIYAVGRETAAFLRRSGLKRWWRLTFNRAPAAPAPW